MLHGLAAYGDDSDSNDEKQLENGPTENGDKTKVGKYVDNEIARRTAKQPVQKSQVVIKRPQHKPRTAQPRAHISEELDSPRASSSRDIAPTSPQAESLTPDLTPSTSQSQPEELQRIRDMLRPPPIPGVADWGIPPEPGPNECEPCDPTIEAKLLQFYNLKHPTASASSSATSASDPITTPRHFNDSLMSNRSFRNPHLYAKLVEFVDVDERETNFPKELWDPYQIVEGKHGWDAEKIGTTTSEPSFVFCLNLTLVTAAHQKARSEQQAQTQTFGKRSQLEFTSASSHSGHGKDKGQDLSRNRYNPYNAGGKAGYGSSGRGRISWGK
ncbi:hypothetical protein AAF712_005756 [Marasmius tenuissimus]|uniref:HCNGP-like protein n=1 Tax=Marasmius tenuissimus TaxID=585030 RepID=A0ABR3A1G1_9AGAR|nr:hypothetical protein PM082_010817 [Marasmius tenuissimus]